MQITLSFGAVTILAIELRWIKSEYIDAATMLR
jgi:hypothetical protein